MGLNVHSHNNGLLLHRSASLQSDLIPKHLHPPTTLKRISWYECMDVQKNKMKNISPSFLFYKMFKCFWWLICSLGPSTWMYAIKGGIPLPCERKFKTTPTCQQTYLSCFTSLRFTSLSNYPALSEFVLRLSPSPFCSLLLPFGLQLLVSWHMLQSIFCLYAVGLLHLLYLPFSALKSLKFSVLIPAPVPAGNGWIVVPLSDPGFLKVLFRCGAAVLTFWLDSFVFVSSNGQTVASPWKPIQHGHTSHCSLGARAQWPVSVLLPFPGWTLVTSFVEMNTQECKCGEK